MAKKLLIFRGGAILTDVASVNKFQINGEDPISTLEPTKTNLDKYLKQHKYPPLKK